MHETLAHRKELSMARDDAMLVDVFLFIIIKRGGDIYKASF